MKEELLDKIKHSADKVDIPKSLEPEQMEEKLKTSSNKGSMKDRWNISSKGWIMAACVVFVIFIARLVSLSGGIEIAQDSGVKSTADQMTEVAGTSETADEAGSAAAKENAESAKANSNSEATDSRGASPGNAIEGMLTQAAGYEEVYDKLFAEAVVTDDSTSGSVMSEQEKLMGESIDYGSVEPQAAAPQKQEKDYSQTNIQAEGVDEGDIVKTDGDYIYFADRGKGIRIVKAENGVMELVSMIPIPSPEEEIREMYLDRDILCIVTSQYQTKLSEDGDTDQQYSIEGQKVTSLYTYDITDRSRVELKGCTTQEGEYETTRKNGDYIYMLTNYYPQPVDNWENIEAYIPSINGKTAKAEEIYLPNEDDRYTGYLVMSSVNTKEPTKAVDTKMVLGSSHIYTMGTGDIYISLDSFHTTTNIAHFAYQEGKFEARAAGSVNGYLNDTFSLNEYNGYLRVVTTSFDSASGEESNNLYILDSNMQITGKIEGLAKKESIRSARFLGDTAYFVTFQNTDPLFSADLSDPSNPKLLGELKITGFSSYLHFYGENRLLGIGWEADPVSLRTIGLKLSMFDISDPTNVTEVNKLVLEDVYDCTGLNDYNSVLIDPGKNILGFGYVQSKSREEQQGQGDGAYSNDITGKYSLFTYDDENGFVNTFTHFDAQGTADPYTDTMNTRGVYIDSIFYLCGENGIKAYDMGKEYELIKEIIW